MFGVNFFKKNESPIVHTPKPSLKWESLEVTNNKIEDLQDSINMWNTQNHIEMQKLNLSPDIANMFKWQASPISESNEIAPGESTTSEEESILKAQEEAIFPQEILPQSENDLLSQVKNEYATSIFFDKTYTILIKRGVPEEKLPNIMEHIFTKMALKSVESFKSNMEQILNETGLDELDTENYIYWRLNEYTNNNIMYLVENNGQEMLVAENFVNGKLLETFFTKTENIEGTPEEDQEADVVTSEKIDELLNDINNI